MAEKQIIVFIYLPGEVRAVPAGIFTHDSDAGVGRFVYGRRYLERSRAMAADPISLPLGVEPAPVETNGGLYGAFRDASPDYWGRLVIASELKLAPEALSETDFLMYANATRIGNLDFRETPESPEPELCPPSFHQMGDIMVAAAAIENGRSADQCFLDLLRQGSSMGGARPKCTVEWNDALWIAKFPSKGDTLNIPVIEYATMKLAESCGIHIPDIKLESVAGKTIYLIRRFDREKAEKGWVRHGFISSLSLMKLDERDRLDWSYPAIAAEMRRHCPASDIVELYKRMVFNILVRNTDDHPRNHGFLTGKKGGLMLSPAYDIVPDLTPAGVGTGFNLAMHVGHKGREASIENALSNCEQFGLSFQQAQSLIDELREHISDWQAFFRNLGVPHREIMLLRPSIKG